jgi:hypothetical protein
MGGGILQLVASKGIENLYLNIDPQITPWKTVYRRHTEFSLFDHELSLKKTSYGDTIISNLKNIGDTTLGLSLQVELSDINLEFDAPTVKNIRILLQEYGIVWNTSNYDDDAAVTTAIYTSVIEPLIEAKLDTNIDTYSYYNEILSLVDSNVKEAVDVFSGSNYLIKSTAFNHNSLITEISNVNITLNNNLSIMNRSDVYVLVDTDLHDIDENTTSFTMIPNNGLLFNIEDELMCVSSRYLDIQTTYNSSALSASNSKYVALKVGAITGDYAVSQSITATGNIYLASGSAQNFPPITQNRLISKINNSLFVQDGNSKIELFDYDDIDDEQNLVYFLVYVGNTGASMTTVSVDTTSLDIWRVDPLDANTAILYFSRSYLEDYNATYPSNTSGGYVAINRLPFTTGETTINITMSEYGYQISPGVNRRFSMANLPSSSESFHIVMHHDNLIKDSTDNTLDISIVNTGSHPVKFIGQTQLNLLTASSAIEIDDIYVEQTNYTGEPNFLVRGNTGDLENASFYSETDYFLVPKISATYNSGTDKLSFTKEDILRTRTDYRYNMYKTPLVQSNTLIDTSITSADKDSTNIYSLITYYRTEPFMFLMQFYERLYRPMTSPENYNTYLVLHRGLIALMKDVLYTVNRNITLCTMFDIINKTYDKYLENILNYDKLYSTYIFTHSDSTDDDGDLITWTDPYTLETTTNITVRISLNRENIHLMHIIDMENYGSMPFNSGTVRKYFDNIIDRSYSSSTQYTSLDNYIIYTNYINSIHELTNNIDNIHNREFIEDQSTKIVESMNYNYIGNLEILYRTIESIENIKIGSLPVHASNVYQSTNIYSDVNSHRTYGKLDHNNISNQKINIVDDILNGKMGEDGIEIFYSTEIIKSYKKFTNTVHNNSNNKNIVSYFDKTVYWNDLMTSSYITSISETSMKATLDIQGGTTTSNYISAFTNKRAILSHLPYALVQNIPYAIDTIILNGGLLTGSSGTYGFPDVINSEKNAFATLMQSLFSYVHDGSFVDVITITGISLATLYTLDKGTILDDLEDEMFIKCIGTTKSTISTYYHKDYINSLKHDSDSANSYYVISPFFIDTLSNLPSENGFSAETGLTPVEYVVKYYKRLFKATLVDLLPILNSADYAKNIAVITGGGIALGSATISFFDIFYNKICEVLDGYLQTTIIDEYLYSNNLSLFTDRHVFSNLRLGDHNYRLLDIQSAIWNNIQKKNIRAFNELYYDTILSRTLITDIAGTSMLTLFDRLMLVITGISGVTYYKTSYNDLLGNTYSNNSSELRTDLDPVGFIGLDYYRLRNNTAFTSIKDRIHYEIEYFSYLYNERYEKLKTILNVRYVKLSKENYMFAGTQNIIIALTEKLSEDYELPTYAHYGSMSLIIGHVSGGDPADFVGVANEIHDECVTATDLIANIAGNHTHTPYAKIYLASTDTITNQFIIGTDPYLYAWFDDNKSVVSMTLPFALYQIIDNKLTPSLLYTNSKRYTVFNNYLKYSDVVLSLLDSLVETYTTVASRPLYNNLAKNYSSNSNVYSDIVNVCIENIEASGDIIMQLGVLSDGATDYKVDDSQVISSVTWEYRYKIIEDGDASVDDSQLQILIDNMINRSSPKFKYVEELGHRLIKESIIRFDSQNISKITDEILSHHARVNNTIDQQRGYNISIGNTTEMKNFDTKQKSIKKLNIPLCHWFNTDAKNDDFNPLATVALLHTDVLHHLVLNNYEDLIIIETGAKYIRKPKLKCKLLGRFAYVGSEERMKLAKNRIEYLIPMYQYGGEYIFENKDIYQTNKINMKLNFSDPTKYIWWKIEFHKRSPTTSEHEDDKFNWTVRELKQSSTLYYRTMDQCKFKFNGKVREDYKDYTYWNAYHPYTREINNLNKGEFVLSFGIHPLRFQPSGHASMSSISDFFTIMKLHDAAINALNNGYIMKVKWWSLTVDVVVAMSGIGGRLFFGVKE